MHSMYRYVTVLHKHVRVLGRLGEAVVGEADVCDHEHEVVVGSLGIAARGLGHQHHL